MSMSMKDVSTRLDITNLSALKRTLKQQDEVLKLNASGPNGRMSGLSNHS